MLQWLREKPWRWWQSRISNSGYAGFHNKEAVMFQFISGTAMIFIILAVFFLMSAIKILNEYERGVIFRLGRALDYATGPGLIILIPIVDKMVKVNLQLVTYEVPSQDIITRANVTMKV